MLAAEEREEEEEEVEIADGGLFIGVFLGGKFFLFFLFLKRAGFYQNPTLLNSIRKIYTELDSPLSTCGVSSKAWVFHKKQIKFKKRPVYCLATSNIELGLV